MLFATHYLQEADDAADRVVVIVGGRKVADGPPGAIKARFGDRQVRFTLRDKAGLLGALAGVRAVDRDGPRVTLHSSDTDATVASLVSSGLGWSGLDVGGLDLETPSPAAARGDVMTGFVTLELRRCVRDARYLVITVALPVGLYLLFTGLFGAHGKRALGLPQPVELMVAMIAYGAMWAVFSATGPRIAHERAIGWTRQLRVTPLAPASALGGKLVTALAAALPAMLLVASPRWSATRSASAPPSGSPCSPPCGPERYRWPCSAWPSATWPQTTSPSRSPWLFISPLAPSAACGCRCPPCRTSCRTSARFSRPTAWPSWAGGSPAARPPS